MAVSRLRPDRCPPAHRWPWSGATAPASRPPCGCSPACCRRPRARCGSPASTPCAIRRAAKARVGYCPDVGGLIPRATAWEHLQLAATLRGCPSAGSERAADLLDALRPRPASPTGSRPASPTAWAGGCPSCSPPSTPPTSCCSTSRSTASTRSASRRTMQVIQRAAAAGVGRPRVHAPARPRRAGLRRGRRAASRDGRRPPRRPPSWPASRVRPATGPCSHDRRLS